MEGDRKQTVIKNNRHDKSEESDKVKSRLYRRLLEISPDAHTEQMCCWLVYEKSPFDYVKSAGFKQLLKGPERQAGGGDARCGQQRFNISPAEVEKGDFALDLSALMFSF